MQQVTVGSKYQIVIPKEIRRKIRDLKPGVKVAVHAQNNKTVTIKTEEKTWLERTRGMMKNAWKGIDTTKYLEDLRNEWDKKS
ncbi:MAG: AbrB/MazE/SpoVT family DNA-binding domain-containing protein [Candidatus Levybacteria bacterium]|nr:AbrB/MazE/SpoVT family DNA-binding domain-containing protein [Candidatus Levybacteria bacterium]